MIQPTIDEMLEWLIGTQGLWENDYRDHAMRQAIRAILEQHRNAEGFVNQFDLNQMKLEAIRAFVDRVERRMANWDMQTAGASHMVLSNALRSELAALDESEV